VRAAPCTLPVGWADDRMRARRIERPLARNARPVSACCRNPPRPYRGLADSSQQHRSIHHMQTPSSSLHASTQRQHIAACIILLPAVSRALPLHVRRRRRDASLGISLSSLDRSLPPRHVSCRNQSVEKDPCIAQ
jgi:hypothetical protein